MEYGLGPIIERSSGILILGSFPGPLSLKKREYYAHPQNQFWHILANLLGQEDTPKDYKKKKALLAKFGIGLWDMVASCKRSGAYDGNIRDMTLNDIRGLLDQYPNIKAVFLNGRKAEALFKKHCKLSVCAKYLPSTSPAYAGISRNKKLGAWESILKFISNR
ncbi:MAG: DNA-deoxyinosine glycosylase [Candidatus Omnitrophota bacterium]|jgi:hypoxanthine-DNA glycosylase|nr:DNA-deoxyinosine glycosylase [Candidatus Omnitrophota bacterium]